MASVSSVNVSKNITRRKTQTDMIVLEKGHGIVGDSFAGNWHRQVCLLPAEGIKRHLSSHRRVPRPGLLYENINISGIDPDILQIGMRLSVGSSVIEITQLGEPDEFKEGDANAPTNSRRFALYILEREAVFGIVLQDGIVKPGDKVEILK